ncbi:MAG: hypothetical protein WA705_21845 [Candidatus Ozemobacteraceae bacterium]
MNYSISISNEIIDLNFGKFFRFHKSNKVLILKSDLVMIKTFFVKAPKDLLAECLVKDCWASIWCVKLGKDVPDFSIKYFWEPGYKWAYGDMDNDERYAGITFENNDFIATIGTEDNQCLFERSEGQDDIPKRFCKNSSLIRIGEWCFNDSVQAYEETGFRISFPNLLKGDFLRFLFSIAWTSKPIEHIPTFNASDRSFYRIREDLIKMKMHDYLKGV